MTPKDIAAAFVVILVWALNFVVVKVGVGQIPPLMLVAMRFALVATLLARFLRPHGKPWPLMIALSVLLGSLHFGLMFTGLQGVDAGPAAVAIHLAVPFATLLAAVVFRERIGAAQALGMIVAFAGVYVLAGEPAVAPSLVHLLLVVAAAMAWGGANILIKVIGPINVFVLNAWVCLLALPQVVLVSAVVEEGHRQAVMTADWRGWGAVLYTALGASITAYGLWYYLLGRYEVNRVVPLTLLAPVFAVGFAVILIDEPITLRLVLGGLVTIAGVAMIQFLRPAPKAAEARP